MSCLEQKHGHLVFAKTSLEVDNLIVFGQCACVSEMVLRNPPLFFSKCGEGLDLLIGLSVIRGP